jgi:hypothetical protein
VGQKTVFDLCGLDTEAAEFQLVVQASEEDDICGLPRRIWSEQGSVACRIQAVMGGAGYGIRDEALPG